MCKRDASAQTQKSWTYADEAEKDEKTEAIRQLKSARSEKQDENAARVSASVVCVLSSEKIVGNFCKNLKNNYARESSTPPKLKNHERKLGGDAANEAPREFRLRLWMSTVLRPSPLSARE